MYRLRNLLLVIMLALFITPINADRAELDNVPVLFNGRVQPLDSVARQVLISLREKSSIKRDAKNIDPTQWLWGVLTRDPAIDKDDLFLIHDQNIKHEYKLDKNKKFSSFETLKPHIFKIQAKAQGLLEKENRNVYENNIVQLANKLQLFMALQHTFVPFSDRTFHDYLTAYHQRVKKGLRLFNAYNKDGYLNNQTDQLHLMEFNQDFKRHQEFAKLAILYLYPVKKEGKIDWTNTGTELLKSLDYDHIPHPVMQAYADLTKATKLKDENAITKQVEKLQTLTLNKEGISKYRILAEVKFNQWQPFYAAMCLYVLIFILMLIVYLKHSQLLLSIVTKLSYFTFSLHTLGLIARIWIQERPPVTNLYSSAVFVGWAAIGLCLLIERWYKQKWGYSVLSALGFITLIIAHHLALQSDTLEQMQAVLDSNFWLATHVITITLGYSGTFLAGAFATFYILRNIKNPQSKDQKRALHTMVYGTICFSLFFSFIGTVLGGIWADQSWGRFWGWDPKENGALLIVIWNAMILHAHLAKLIKTRGLMITAVLGNIVTAFSWFGVNMLGVGLHSYGFMQSAFHWLLGYCAAQLILVFIAFNFGEDKQIRSN